ncbi:MAG: hypothetical protein DRN65_05735 [Thaumarchaeota archaeon]|nr:MAG: hypothetical protein DRN65_05735 [Nitrososphaerota archaeon]
MIKLKQIKTKYGRATLVFEADFPDGTVRTVEIDDEEIRERLKTVRKILGRPATKTDLKYVIKTLFKELREGKEEMPETFDYAEFIEVDLEAEG